MWESLVVLTFAAGGWLWFDSMRARERALAEGMLACERNDLQFLDDTVECISLRPARNEHGRLILRRIYRFEFSDAGHGRRIGQITMLGHEVDNLSMEPFVLEQR
jgi:hypothetical protein